METFGRQRCAQQCKGGGGSIRYISPIKLNRYERRGHAYVYTSAGGSTVVL